MKLIFFSFRGLVFSLVLLSTSVFSADIFREVSQDLSNRTKRIVFDNGLRLILVQRNESPTLAIYTKFLVGAVDETPEIAGTAHLLEHMLFKGTPSVGTRDFAKEKKYQDQIEEWGPKLDRFRLEKRDLVSKGIPVPDDLEEKIERYSKRLKNLQEWQDKYIIKNEDSYIFEQHGEVGFNAYTSQDVTNYQIQLPANRLEIWAKMESDRLKNPVLREYYTERDVVIEERRMRTENSGPSLLRERFFATAFESHPYMRPVIGFPSVIPFLDIGETKDFFKKHYHPGNMVITIVGQQNFSETEQIVRKYFSDIPKGPEKPKIKTLEIQSRGRKTVEVEYPSGESMMMGWLKPTMPHPDNSAFDVLDGILAGGPTSRLYKALVINERLASGVSSSNGLPGERYSNLFMIFIRNQANADKSKIEAIIWRELEKIEKEGVTQEEIDRVKNDSISDFFRYMDSNSAIADSFGYYELLTGDWKNLFSVYNQMNQVDSSAIQKIVKNYLQKNRVTIGYLVTPSQKSGFAESQKGEN